MLIAECPDPDCGAPAEVTPWAVAAITSGPVPHVRTLCANKHRYLLPATWIRSHDTRHPTRTRSRPASQTPAPHEPAGDKVPPPGEPLGRPGIDEPCR